jgi:hypothetical protein
VARADDGGAGAMADRLPVSYVLPVRWADDAGRLDELAGYLAGPSRVVAEVIVVDGSAERLRARRRAAFGDAVRLLLPQFWPGGNGKVGPLTGCC